MVDLQRKVFYTLQKYGKGEFGLKRRDGFTFDVEGISFNVHELVGEGWVISEASTGTSIKTVGVVSTESEIEGAEEAVKLFLRNANNVNIVSDMKKYFETPRYKNMKEAYILMLKAHSFMNEAERC